MKRGRGGGPDPSPEMGETHPFIVSTEAVQRSFTVMSECATASKLRVGAK